MFSRFYFPKKNTAKTDEFSDEKNDDFFDEKNDEIDDFLDEKVRIFNLKIN